MKISLHHNFNPSLKIGYVKSNLHHLRNNFILNASKLKKIIVTNEVFKMNLIYFTSALSIILLLAFIQLLNVNVSLKIVVGLSVLAGNVWILNKNDL